MKTIRINVPTEHPQPTSQLREAFHRICLKTPLEEYEERLFQHLWKIKTATEVKAYSKYRYETTKQVAERCISISENLLACMGKEVKISSHTYSSLLLEKYRMELEEKLKQAYIKENLCFTKMTFEEGWDSYFNGTMKLSIEGWMAFDKLMIDAKDDEDRIYRYGSFVEKYIKERKVKRNITEKQIKAQIEYYRNWLAQETPKGQPLKNERLIAASIVFTELFKKVSNKTHGCIFQLLNLLGFIDEQNQHQDETHQIAYSKSLLRRAKQYSINYDDEMFPF